MLETVRLKVCLFLTYFYGGWIPVGAGALAGFFLPLAWDAWRNERVLMAEVMASFMLPWLLCLAAWGVLPYVANTEHSFLHLLLPLWGLLVGGVLCWFFGRDVLPAINRWTHRATRTSALTRREKTDIRTVESLLPRGGRNYDPRKHFRPKKGVFVGLDEHSKPVYLSEKTWLETNVALVGRTRAGKGVAFQTLGTQAIQRGETVVMMDPKPDRWMPSIFRQACEAAGVPFVLIDLRADKPPQINLFQGCTAHEAENVFLGAFSLRDKGESSDFYRIDDRRAAASAGRLAAEHNATPAELLTAYGDHWQDTAKGFWGALCEWADLPAINAKEGPALADLVAAGGCIYVIGEMDNTKVVKAQRAVVLRVLQIAAANQAAGRKILLALDEFKAHISRPSLIALGTAVGNGVRSVLSFQSVKDLYDCPADCPAEAVTGAVWDNCGVKLVFAQQDGDTAEFLAKSTGTVQVDDEARRVKRNFALAEIVDEERTVRQAEAYAVDLNMLYRLPPGVGVLLEVGRPTQFAEVSRMPGGIEMDPVSMRPTFTERQTVRPAHRNSLAESARNEPETPEKLTEQPITLAQQKYALDED